MRSRGAWFGVSRSWSSKRRNSGRFNQAGAGFRSLTEAIDTTTPAGRMMMQMVGSFAEFERAMIRERTSAGIAAARAAGRVEADARSSMPARGGRSPVADPADPAVSRVPTCANGHSDAQRRGIQVGRDGAPSSRRAGGLRRTRAALGRGATRRRVAEPGASLSQQPHGRGHGQAGPQLRTARPRRGCDPPRLAALARLDVFARADATFMEFARATGRTCLLAVWGTRALQ